MDPYSPPHYKTNETDRNNMESKNKRERERAKRKERVTAAGKYSPT